MTIDETTENPRAKCMLVEYYMYFNYFNKDIL